MIPDEDTKQRPVVTDLGGATALSYRKARNIAARLYKKADADDKKVISGMVSDCEFVEEWLVTGRRPGNKRGVERLAAYQREKLIDPLRMQAYVSNSKAGSPSNLTDSDYFVIEEALRVLTDLEKDCFLLSYGHCMPHSYIADVLGLSRGNISTLLKRAKEKIQENRNNNLFLA
ncbi:RNA polymerase subunit sigma-24 [Paenibacillus polymyxa]|jgi:RNA polymerase sigma factor (sigma-70 family)|uniref:sigma factor-like helix-turn-helix DNA-binding protein n=1 Tax=Paenibacillus polymyxa TaxID=1406 RepID=UPI0015805FF8|nr:sigma factor-like helix-turn-helix DNA-binding protein [Paenibacillus polymyxa]MBY0024533.1 RNA polymerase subunit sigma-24 [Paenibacillus polymyxa]MBY0058661.1 RNA polymerase subunit sigma-24 [Paenibacillus polymyxa]MBY0071247.1 RNA polymerase subunit sigma-24 [Paenibacillus polymyxa]MBY0078597.1 RNA polymerase subunit sigma-24 [Paenibacillus polymyxa]MBZ6441700.1 RNA polymerase subunit sigma-24 [Paenibacillus polymyxa]